MAIVIEEEKKPVNWFAMIIVFIILGIIGSGSYILFFKKPELIEVVAPSQLQEIDRISALTFDPASVIDSPAFKSLRQYASEILQVQIPGRDNPFAPIE